MRARISVSQALRIDTVHFGSDDQAISIPKSVNAWMPSSPTGRRASSAAIGSAEQLGFPAKSNAS
jgi:hypothetical protein